MRVGIILLLFCSMAVFAFFFIGAETPAQEVLWGVNFSQKHAALLGLDWRSVYLALLEELGAQRLKVAAHWDLLEQTPDTFSFEDLDWQVQEAALRNASILLVVGMKTTRWPECHIPSWAKGLTKEKQQQEILGALNEIVLRYKDSPAVWGWQVENEPFFLFGECPWKDSAFLRQEVDLVHKLDAKRPVVISESGEGSLWILAGAAGDIVGTTLYRKIWFSKLGRYIDYPFPATFYKRRAQLIQWLFGKEVIAGELQAEPWGPTLIYDSSLEEQQKTMNKEQFLKTIEFAKRTGIKEFYLWGAEWWYWLKETQGDETMWNEAGNVL